jgi:predicted NUDIX family NTP pyrophosphohydrolase
MARTPVLAAGGIVLRLEDTPLIAVVRLRKRNEWVLPKGKLDDGETPRAAAEREVNEETTRFPCTNFWARWSMSPADGPRSCTTGAWKPVASPFMN